MADRARRPIGKGPPEPDAEVMFELTGSSSGGRLGHVVSGYRPQYVVRSDYHTSVAHQFVGVDRVSPSERAKAEVWFITPEAYPHSLWEGRRVEIAEGAKRVGVATILKVLNPLLLKPGGGAT
jgi:translation elongation factor EF-Tu-like GTPase